MFLLQSVSLFSWQPFWHSPWPVVLDTANRVVQKAGGCWTMIEAKMANTPVANRVVQVPAVGLLLAVQKTKTDSFDQAKTTSLEPSLVPRAVHEESQVQGRVARRKIMETTTIALPVAVDLVLESEAAVEDDNRTIFRRK